MHFHSYCWRSRFRRRRGSLKLSNVQIEHKLSGVPTGGKLVGYSHLHSGGVEQIQMVAGWRI